MSSNGIKGGHGGGVRCWEWVESVHGSLGLQYLREEELGDRLGQILKDIHIPDGILGQLQDSLLNDRDREEESRKHEGERLTSRLALVQRRLDQAYQDKLDGKISEELWIRKSTEWQAEASQIRASLQDLETANPERLLAAVRIFANKAYFCILSKITRKEPNF